MRASITVNRHHVQLHFVHVTLPEVAFRLEALTCITDSLQTSVLPVAATAKLFAHVPATAASPLACRALGC